MSNKELSPLQKLLASSQSQITSAWRSGADSVEKLFAAKSVGEIEGYLQCMKQHGLITPEEYAEAFEKMTRLWSRL
jgi:hypothetical protein